MEYYHGRGNSPPPPPTGYSSRGHHGYGSSSISLTPLAKSRAMYLGSAVPTETAVGVQAVQEPLLQRYRLQGRDEPHISGTDCWVTVFGSGILMAQVAMGGAVTWFPIQMMHVAAAVRYVGGGRSRGGVTCAFAPLDSPEARGSQHPPLFTAILRNTEGVKVLQCHAFICKTEQAASALVKAATRAFEHREGWLREPPRNLHELAERTPPSAESRVPEGGKIYTGDGAERHYSLSGSEGGGERDRDRDGDRDIDKQDGKKGKRRFFKF